jgi:hypothetical protein
VKRFKTVEKEAGTTEKQGFLVTAFQSGTVQDGATVVSYRVGVCVSV